MSSIWNGSVLRTNYTQANGFTDSTSLARTLRFMNEIQKDICSSHRWANLKIKLKKEIASGIQEFDISPQVPSAATIALLAGGSITTGSVVYVKVTFVLFDEAGKEFNSIESEPSPASNTVTTAGADLALTLTAIDIYDGSTSVKPTVIHRRIYLKVGDGDYVLNKTLENNTAVTTTITAIGTSTIEPPEHSMVELMASEDPSIELSGLSLDEVKLDYILKSDPNLTATGQPYCYVRVSPTRIILYPCPSSAYTLSYWVYKRPAKMFADTDRAIQLDPSLENVFEIGVDWKWYKYKQDSDWLQMFQLYKDMKLEALNDKVKTGGTSSAVKRVC
jgi:hypothetical protein